MRAAIIRFARRIRDTRTGGILRRIYHTNLVYSLFSRFFRMYFGFTSVVGLEPRRAADRGPAPQIDEEQLRSRYEKSGIAGEPDSFVLYRIVGNDLVPRHRKGQSRDNLQFILENEPELPDCEKRFLLNRIVDPKEEEAIIALLEARGLPYLRIPFSLDEYARQSWDMEGLPEPGYTFSKQYDELPEDFRLRLYKRLYRHKNNYLVNNNGARNAALEDGRRRAKWVLPWDGNCFLTAEAWEEIRSAVKARPWHPYVIVPMARVAEHSSLLGPGFRPPADQEPQILFRTDAGETFDEEYYYGRRPKVELLWRLGVPGPWDEWAIEPWDLPYPSYCEDAGAWQQAGWVARLPSGRPHLEAGLGSETKRLDARTEAVTGFLLQKDGMILSARLQGAVRLFCREVDLPAHSSLPSLRENICRTASRKYRRETSRAFRRAENFLLSNRHLPFLLDKVPNHTYVREMELLLDWLQSDAGARMVRRRHSQAGTVHDLFTAVLSAKLGRFDILSRTILFLIDRAAVLFARSGHTAEVCKDEDHRRAWQAVSALADRCGEDLWEHCNRPGCINVKR
jgi:hypothetical protein